jgi:hypothetical protein
MQKTALKLNEKLKLSKFGNWPFQVYFGQAWFQLLVHLKIKML